MKKLLLISALLTMFILFCGCNSEGSTDAHNHSDGHDHSHETENTSTVQETSEVMTESQTEYSTENWADVQDSETMGPLTSKHSSKTDDPFENEYAQAKTDAERIQICDKYREEWEKTGKRYYKELLYYNGDVPAHTEFSTDKEMHEYVEFSKKDFDSYYENESKSYLNEMEKEYGKSDKANALSAKYKFDLQRSFALEMIELYELLGEFNGQEF